MSFKKRGPTHERRYRWQGSRIHRRRDGAGGGRALWDLDPTLVLARLGLQVRGGLPHVFGRDRGRAAFADELHSGSQGRHEGEDAFSTRAGDSAQPRRIAHRQSPQRLPGVRAQPELRAGPGGERTGRARTALSRPEEEPFHRRVVPSLVRDPNKCILCGRCVAVCHSVQGVGAIDFIERGFKTRVGPGFHDGINVSSCIFCGQCTRVCPTAALMEKSQVDDVIAALSDPNAIVVAQVAPAVPATLMEKAKASSVRTMLNRLAAALKRVGFGAVFDTGFAADLTIMEEVSELIRRVQQGGPLPMFTSCSPGWIQYVETQRPELIPHLSTCKSPQQMAAALIKEAYPRHRDRRQAAGVCFSHALHGQEIRSQRARRRRLRAHHARDRAASAPLRHRPREGHRTRHARSTVLVGDRRRPALWWHGRRDGGGHPYRPQDAHRRGAQRWPQGGRGARSRRHEVLLARRGRHHAQLRHRQRARPAQAHARSRFARVRPTCTSSRS